MEWTPEIFPELTSHPDTSLANEMAVQFPILFPHERSALLAALQRDADTQLLNANTDAENARYHLLNHRLVTRLIEIFNALAQ